MNRNIATGGLCLGLLMSAAASAQAPPPQDQPAQPAPNILEDIAYVRRFTAGITGSITPMPLLAASQGREGPSGNPPVELRSNVDPNTKVGGFGVTVQATLTERFAIAVQPIIRSFNTHTFLQRLEGIDNSSTSFDDRDKTETDEYISGRHIDIPLLLRFYSKGHHEEGPRWIFEGGPAMRLTRNTRVDRRIFPPKGGEIKESGTFPSRNGFGFVVGIGGQFIDDFGIRAIPEFRYTHWVRKSFDSLEIGTRTHQIELLFTLSF